MNDMRQDCRRKIERMRMGAREEYEESVRMGSRGLVAAWSS